MNREKKIEDYLHLYLGCEVEVDSKRPSGNELVDDKRRGTFIGYADPHKISVKLAFRAGPHGQVNTFFVKPFLRPLSDMTEEEGREYAKHYGIKGDLPCTISEENGYVKISIGYKNHGASLFPLSDYGQKPESLRYLLSKHFDLFGLIEAGLAIDKTLNKKPNVQECDASKDEKSGEAGSIKI